MELRKILHVDMDAFFAAVEQREHPAWRNKPVIVGGPVAKRGVVSTCSYEARAFGIHSAMPMFEAVKKCPHAIFAPANFSLYMQVSQDIRQIFARYTDLIEPLSIDEAYLDVTENKFNIPSATIVAQCIQQDILRQTGLTCSVGVSFNKFLAKVASNYQKPAGITVVDHTNFDEFIRALKIEDFYGVGRISAQKMKEHGIFTGEDVLKYSLYDLTKRFGKQGYALYNQVRGNSTNRLTVERKRKSIGKETTFSHDTTNETLLKETLQTFALQIAQKLQRQQLVAKTITLKLRDHHFKTINKSHTLPTYIDGAHLMIEEIFQLFDRYYDNEEIRLIGMSVGQLEEKRYAFQQLTLF